MKSLHESAAPRATQHDRRSVTERQDAISSDLRLVADDRVHADDLAAMNTREPVALEPGGKSRKALPDDHIAGRRAHDDVRYTLASNLVGWDAVSLAFDETEATLSMELGSMRTSAAVGLDAVPRITRGTRFSTMARHADIDVAMAGTWKDDHTFEIAFDTIDTIDAGTLSFDFHDTSVTVTLYEKTLLNGSVEFEGAAEPVTVSASRPRQPRPWMVAS